MKKGIVITISIIILLTIGIIFGIFFFRQNKTQDSNMIGDKKLAVQEQETEKSSISNNTISTSSIQLKVSPNCKITEKQYYAGCDHLIKKVKEIPKNWINETQEEFQKHYQEWFIEKFEPDEITVYQEKEGFCGEHYVIKEHNGVLGIYTLDENGIENWKEDTQIQTIYLPEEDIQKLKQGITAIGNSQLHSILEDYE